MSARRQPRWLSAWLLLLVAGSLVPGTEARAGAWLRPPGGAYLKTSWLHADTDQRRSCRGAMEAVDPLGGRFVENQAHVYGEWGAFERLTLLGSFAWKDQRITGATVPEYGTRSTGDLRLGARAPLFAGRAPVSVEGWVAVPTYPRTDLTRPVAEREQFLPAGSGELEAELHLQAGWSLWPLPAYGNLDLGRHFRGGAFGDQWSVALELGSSSDRAFFKVGAQWRIPTGDPCASSTVGAVSFHERSLRAGPELGLRLFSSAGSSTWLYLGSTHLVSGRNALDSTQWSLGLGWERSTD